MPVTEETSYANYHRIDLVAYSSAYDPFGLASWGLELQLHEGDEPEWVKLLSVSVYKDKGSIEKTALNALEPVAREMAQVYLVGFGGTVWSRDLEPHEGLGGVSVARYRISLPS